MYKPTNTGLYVQYHFPLTLTYPATLSPAWNQCKARYQLRTVSMPKLFKLASCWILLCLGLTLPTETEKKKTVANALSSLLTLASLCGPAWHMGLCFSRRTVSSIKYFFQWYWPFCVISQLPLWVNTWAQITDTLNPHWSKYRGTHANKKSTLFYTFVYIQF